MTDISGRWPGGTLRERLLMRVVKGDDCWSWTGYHDEEGRPRFCIDDHPRYAYRLLYEESVGPVPEGLALDHVVCQNPSCMNPAHLEPVTRAVNTQRHYEQATHCRKGHLLDEENRGAGKERRLDLQDVSS